MKVALILIALAAVATADSYGKQHIDYSHVPYYNFDWQVGDKDYYGKVLDYGQTEKREHDNTKTNWWVALPGYAHIKRDEAVNAQVHHSYAQGYDSKPVYKTEYKPIQYKEEYKPVYKTEYKPVYKTEYKPVYKTEYKPVQYKEQYKPVYKTQYKPSY